MNMICTGCFEADMVEGETHIECVGTVPCEECPACGYILFNQEQSNFIDKLRRERNNKVKELLCQQKSQNEVF